MKLHEEFKEYENLWEDAELDPVDEILNDYDSIKFDYDGFTVEGYEDHFDPRYGHWDTAETYEHDDFTYDVDAVSMFEFLRDTFLPKNVNKISDVELATEYKKLESAWENSTDETEDAACEALEIFLAKNLEEFVNIFYYELKEYYSEEAYDWARDNW